MKIIIGNNNNLCHFLASVYCENMKTRYQSYALAHSVMD